MCSTSGNHTIKEQPGSSHDPPNANEVTGINQQRNYEPSTVHSSTHETMCGSVNSPGQSLEERMVKDMNSFYCIPFHPITHRPLLFLFSHPPTFSSAAVKGIIIHRGMFLVVPVKTGVNVCITNNIIQPWNKNQIIHNNITTHTHIQHLLLNVILQGNSCVGEWW